jgi:hypothetical protein
MPDRVSAPDLSFVLVFRQLGVLPWPRPGSSQRFWCWTLSDTAGSLAPTRIGHWRVPAIGVQQSTRILPVAGP